METGSQDDGEVQRGRKVEEQRGGGEGWNTAKGLEMEITKLRLSNSLSPQRRTRQRRRGCVWIFKGVHRSTS